MHEGKILESVCFTTLCSTDTRNEEGAPSSSPASVPSLPISLTVDCHVFLPRAALSS